MSTELNGTLTNSANLVGSFGATAGGTTNYNDLVNKPSINHVELTGNKSGAQLGLVSETDLSTVAFSGNYNDLLHKPNIPAAQVNSDWNAVSGVAQILNKPTIPAAQVNSDWNSNSGVSEILNKPTLSTVATSGSYDDLTDKPTIPEAQVNSDWNAVSGVSEILNKPTLSTVATSGSYNDLTDTPTIPTNSDFNLSGLGDVSISGATQGQVLTKGASSWEASNIVNEIYNKYNLAGVQYCLARNDGKCQFTVRLNGNHQGTTITWNKSSNISVTIYGSTSATAATVSIDNATIGNGVLSVRLSLSVTLSQYTQLARGFLLTIDEQLLATIS